MFSTKFQVVIKDAESGRVEFSPVAGDTLGDNPIGKLMVKADLDWLEVGDLCELTLTQVGHDPAAVAPDEKEEVPTEETAEDE